MVIHGDADTEATKAREYLRIRPSEDALATDRITGQFEQLHAAVDGAAVECLLVSTRDTEEIEYYFGTRPAARRSLQRVLARLFPDSYEFETVTKDPLPPTPEEPDATAVLEGVGQRSDDWQTRLRPPSISDAPEKHETARVEAAPGLPLESIVEGMLAADGRVAYQLLVRPKPDWTVGAECRVGRIDRREDTWGQRVANLLFGSPTVDEHGEVDVKTRDDHREDTASEPGSRVDAILAKSSRAGFDVNARIVADGPDAAVTVRDLAAAFNPVGGDYYRVDGRVSEGRSAETVADGVRTRTFHEGDGVRRRLARWVPLAPNRSPEIVADSTTLPHFCLLDGGSLTPRARRAMKAVPEERTGVTTPPGDTLARYHGPGLTLGVPRYRDGETGTEPVAVPPALQPLHVAVFGKSGAGKSVVLQNAITANAGATGGADVAVLPKGGGAATNLMRAHYAEYGTLDDVYYFDCSEVVPAISPLSIEAMIEAGVPRSSAVTNVVDHHLEVLRSIEAGDRFDDAIRSPDVIRQLLAALFDPVYGDDEIAHRDLERAAAELREDRSPPRTSDEDLQRLLATIASDDDRTLEAVMQGVFSRLDKVPTNDVLRALYDPDLDDDDQDGGPRFDVEALLDEDALVIFDLGKLRTATQRPVTLVLLSELWTALRRRKRRQSDPPLVNLYLEEAASLAVSDVLAELLSQSREFGLSVTLAMQYPAQLEAASETAYREVMNDVSTVLTGNVSADRQLERRLATAAMPPDEVGNRLRALSRGEWLVSLPAPFGESKPRPFVLESPSLPPGHPEGEAPLSDARAAAFATNKELRVAETREAYGREIEGNTRTVTSEAVDASDDSPSNADDDAASDEPDAPVTSTLPFTDRFPRCIDYHEPSHSVACGHCEARYPGSLDGVERAIACHASLDRVDRDDVPVCDVEFRLSADERQESDLTTRQLAALQVVYSATQGHYDPDLAYDSTRDSMLRLREYVGIDRDAFEELVEEGYLVKDCVRPHTLFTVTPQGRDELQIRHREGIAHGPGEGDLSESTLHRVMVTLGARLIETEYREDPDSAVVDVEEYVEVRDGRLDAAGLDDEGEVVVALEAERTNNDALVSVPADYDKMAECDPAEAIWVVQGRDAAHEVLEALNEPATGEVRVEKTYETRQTAPSRFRIDEPGLTDMRTATELKQSFTGD